MVGNSPKSRKRGQLVTVPQAAAELGLDPATVKRAMELKQVCSVELASRRYIPRAELARLIGREGEDE